MRVKKCVYVRVCKVLFRLSQTIIVAETREFESIYYVIFLMVSFRNNLGFPRDSLGKESIHITGYIEDREDAGDMHLIPQLGRFPGGGNGNPLQYSDLESSMDRGAWGATVHGVTESDTTSIHPHHIKNASP